MTTIAQIRDQARKAKNGQCPYLDGLSQADTQKLMDASGLPTRAGTIYTVVADQHGRALRFDGVNDGKEE